MGSLHANDLLHPGALRGVTLGVWPGAAHPIAAAAAALGATVDLATADVVVADAGAAFRAAGGGMDGLRAGGDGAFAAVRDAALRRWIRGEGEAATTPAGGRAIVLGPRPEDGEHAVALQATLESTVMTLGTEWARHGITAVAVLPRAGAADDDVVSLCCFLAGPAGGYYTGTALRPGPPPTAP